MPGQLWVAALALGLVVAGIVFLVIARWRQCKRSERHQPSPAPVLALIVLIVLIASALLVHAFTQT